MMGFRIERVVNGNAMTRSERSIGVDNGIAAAISKDQIVLRNQRGERVRRVIVNAIQSRGASTSQNARKPPLRSTAASSNSSKTPTPLAFTVRSAPPACSSAWCGSE